MCLGPINVWKCIKYSLCVSTVSVCESTLSELNMEIITATSKGLEKGSFFEFVVSTLLELFERWRYNKKVQHLVVGLQERILCFIHFQTLEDKLILG